MLDLDGFALPIGTAGQLILLTGVIDGLGNGPGDDLLLRYTQRFDLSDLHGAALLPAPLDPYRTRATAMVGLASMNGEDGIDEWTWAIDRVATSIEKGHLWLTLDLAVQGGPTSGSFPWYLHGYAGPDYLIARISYQVTVVIG